MSMHLLLCHSGTHSELNFWRHTLHLNSYVLYQKVRICLLFYFEKWGIEKLTWWKKSFLMFYFKKWECVFCFTLKSEDFKNSLDDFFPFLMFYIKKWEFFVFCFTLKSEDFENSLNENKSFLMFYIKKWDFVFCFTFKSEESDECWLLVVIKTKSVYK